MFFFVDVGILPKVSTVWDIVEITSETPEKGEIICKRTFWEVEIQGLYFIWI